MFRIVYNVNIHWRAYFNTFPCCFHFLTVISLCFSSYVWSLNNLHYSFSLSPIVNFYYLVGIILAVEI
jgi:hypothetical protein